MPLNQGDDCIASKPGGYTCIDVSLPHGKVLVFPLSGPGKMKTLVQKVSPNDPYGKPGQLQNGSNVKGLPNSVGQPFCYIHTHILHFSLGVSGCTSEKKHIPWSVSEMKQEKGGWLSPGEGDPAKMWVYCKGLFGK